MTSNESSDKRNSLVQRQVSISEGQISAEQKAVEQLLKAVEVYKNQ
jgi:hypothetical protein